MIFTREEFKIIRSRVEVTINANVVFGGYSVNGETVKPNFIELKYENIS